MKSFTFTICHNPKYNFVTMTYPETHQKTKLFYKNKWIALGWKIPLFRNNPDERKISFIRFVCLAIDLME